MTPRFWGDIRGFARLPVNVSAPVVKVKQDPFTPDFPVKIKPVRTGTYETTLVTGKTRLLQFDTSARQWFTLCPKGRERFPFNKIATWKGLSEQEYKRRLAEVNQNRAYWPGLYDKETS